MKKIKIKEPQFNYSAYVFYRDKLLEHNKELKKALLEIETPQLNNSIFVKNDAYEEIDKMIERISSVIDRFKALPIIRAWTKKVRVVSDKRWKRSIAERVEIDLSLTDEVKEALEKREVYSTQLIKTVQGRLKDQIISDMNAKIMGNNKLSVYEIINKAVKKTAGNFDLLALNESLQLSKDIALARAESLGVTEYVYKTAGDERVRKHHVESNNKTYDLVGNNKGNRNLKEIRCRCVRVFVFDI